MMKVRVWNPILYLSWIREKPCAKCGLKGGIAHHESLGANAVGAKPPDTHALPLCHECHQERHRIGPGPFFVDLNPAYLCLRYLTRYLTGHDVYL